MKKVFALIQGVSSIIAFILAACFFPIGFICGAITLGFKAGHNVATGL